MSFALRSTRRVLAAVLLLGGCVSEKQEVDLGREYATELDGELPFVADATVNAFLTDLGTRLAHAAGRPELNWRFQLVNSAEVNAFALPGGYIYLNRGLVERMTSLDQLAGVLGHEIAHVVLRHAADRMEKAGRANVGVVILCSLTEVCERQGARTAIDLAGSAWLASHSRGDEQEADSAAIEIVIRAGISPEGIAAFFEMLLQARERQPTAVDGFFGTHPLEETRVRETRRIMDEIEPAVLGGLLRDAPAFHAMQARLRAYPPPPPPRPPPATPR